ncbi:MAG: zinc ribbon domain-containing protein [Lachnospiraceae bacterium]|nr:zinc ribbon domain-containing protein [Lachnospiraceae bacterium]
MAKFCRFCGSAIREGVKFCPKCGKNLIEAQAGKRPGAQSGAQPDAPAATQPGSQTGATTPLRQNALGSDKPTDPSVQQTNAFNPQGNANTFRKEPDLAQAPYPQPPKTKNKNGLLIALAVILALLAVVATVMVVLDPFGFKTPPSPTPAPVPAPRDPDDDEEEDASDDDGTIDLFEDIHVIVTGVPGQAIINEIYGEYEGIGYTCVPLNAKLGDTVSITAYCTDFDEDDVVAYCRENFGAEPEAVTINYTIDELSPCPETVKDIPDETIQEMVSYAEAYMANKAATWPPNEALLAYDYVGCIYLKGRQDVVVSHTNLVDLIFKTTVIADGIEKTFYRVVEFVNLVYDGDDLRYEVGDAYETITRNGGEQIQVGTASYYGFLSLKEIKNERLTGLANHWDGESSINLDA